jgi:hypothetical protein
LKNIERFSARRIAAMYAAVYESIQEDNRHRPGVSAW